jgi:hypothetical protein
MEIKDCGTIRTIGKKTKADITLNFLFHLDNDGNIRIAHAYINGKKFYIFEWINIYCPKTCSTFVGEYLEIGL